MTSRNLALRRVSNSLSLVVRAWWIVAMCALVAGTSAFLYSLNETPVYRSTATLYVTAGTDANTAAAYQGSLASQQRIGSYAQLVLSDSVLSAAIRDSGSSKSVSELRAMAEVKTTPETVLFKVSVYDPDSAEAAMLANSISAALLSSIDSLERPPGASEALAKATVVSPAVATSVPVSPNRKRYVVFGIIIGALVGILIVVIRSRFDNKVRTPDDVKDMELSVLSVIPADEALASRRFGPDYSFGATAAAEAYRKLRTNLSFVVVDTPSHCLVVTSPRPGDGKTTTAISMAIASAEDGKKTLLVDADLRRPTIDERFGLAGSVGLSTVLSANLDWRDAIQDTEWQSLSVLCSGEVPPNPAELLGSARAVSLFEALKEEYERIIIDSPPVLPVTDSAVLAALADGVVLVVRSGTTKTTDTVSAVEQLERADAGVFGVVLNYAEASNGVYSYLYEYSRP
ncbi:hypothetical protein A5785_00975 [Gordonia sp. 852002-50395_SCH5434458]|nr:hypothetical protein A5785_00975 [Gordonia sp. 852002-50395_SCH5434458]